MKQITKAIIPVAGWGTRRLPITKAIEKCMLPVGNRPVIDYIVQDCLKAGIKDIYFVVSNDGAQIKSYYQANNELNQYLKKNNREKYLPLVAPPSGVNFYYINQDINGDYGSSVPVGLASKYIAEDESALVIMGDQFFYRKDDGGSNAADLIKLVEESGLTAGLFGNELPEERIPLFGIIEKDADDCFVQIVEKPSIEEAPSNLNNSSFYVLNKELFELARTLPVNPKRGEFELTDAINAYVAQGGRIVVGIVNGEYMECGSVEGWLHANRVVLGDI